LAVKQHRRAFNLPVRVIIVGALILLQIAILAILIYNLSGKVVWVYSLFEFITVPVVIFVIIRKGNPSQKLAWVVFILGLPIVGCIVYMFWGGARTFPHLKKRMAQIESKQMPYLTGNLAVEAQLRLSDELHFRQFSCLRGCSGFPVYSGTACEYFSPCEAGLDKILEELELADHYIFMEFFILAEGKMWNQIYAILKRKAAEGVDIRIMFDDFGSVARQYRGFLKRLRADNIKVSVFNPLRPSIDVFMNNRNHRKMVIIDGKVAISGGFNIGDEYINLESPFGNWMDNILIIKGESVKSFVVMFCIMWSFTTRQTMDANDWFAHYSGKTANGFVQPYCDGPFNLNNPAESLYMQMINTAKQYVYITTPYLILDNEMITALKIASKSGIDVRIITPKIPDKWYVHPVTQFFYAELMEAGVKIYEYTPGFIHSKLFVSDDRVASVGTINMDFRSFYYHFECGVWICDNPVVMDIKNDILGILKNSEEINPEVWKKRPAYIKLKQTFLRLFAPFM